RRSRAARHRASTATPVPNHSRRAPPSGGSPFSRQPEGWPQSEGFPMLTHSSPVIAIAGDGGPCHEQLERVLGARGLRTVRFDPHAVEPAPLALALLDAHHHLQLLPSLSERDVAVVAYGRDPALALEAGRLGARAWLSVPLDDAAIGRCIEAQLAPAGSERAPSSAKPRPGH